MFERNQERSNQAVTWFFPIVGLLLAIGLAFGVGFLQGGENERRYSAPRQHQQSAEKRALDECRGADRASVIKCAQEHIQVSEEAARGEQDLTAQQQAAWAAIYGTLIAAAVLVVTGVGTALIYEQIKLTRKAVKDTGLATEAMQEANAITRQQLRPFIIVENVELGDYNDIGSRYFRINYKNFGQAPAVKVTVVSQACHCSFPIPHEPPSFVESPAEQSLILAAGQPCNWDGFIPNAMSRLAGIKKEEVAMLIYGTITYREREQPPESDPFVTRFAYHATGDRYEAGTFTAHLTWNSAT